MAVMLEYDVLKNAREHLGLTAAQIANKANVTLRQYQRFESGERSLSASSFMLARRIWKALELDVSSFSKGNENDSSDEAITEYQEQIETGMRQSAKCLKIKFVYLLVA